jgi:hypothetical protein
MWQNSTAQVEAVIKYYLRGVFPEDWNYDKKIEAYRELTKDHFFLLIDNLNGGLYRCKIDLGAKK